MKPLTREAWVKKDGEIVDVFISGAAPGYTRAGDGDAWYKVSLQRFNFLVYKDLVRNFISIQNGFRVDLSNEEMDFYTNKQGLSRDAILYLYDDIYKERMSFDSYQLAQVDQGDYVLACDVFNLHHLMQDGTISVMIYSLSSLMLKQGIESKIPKNLLTEYKIVSPNVFIVSLKAEDIPKLREIYEPRKLIFNNELLKVINKDPAKYCMTTKFSVDQVKEVTGVVMELCNTPV